MSITKENRKRAEEFVLDILERMAPGNPNVEETRKKFASMTDKDFAEFVEAIEKEEQGFVFVQPNFADHKVTTANNLKLDKDLDFSFFTTVERVDPDTGLKFIRPKPSMLLSVYVRRQSQTNENKISIPDDDKRVDAYTGQATGESKGASVTATEVQLQHAQRMDMINLEQLKYRGGDEVGYRMLKRQAYENGEVSLAYLNRLGTKAKALDFIAFNLMGGHLDNNLLGD